MADRPPTTYFTLCDADYFLGAAALVNSLALTGNGGRVVVVDTGLETWQRERLTGANVEVAPLEAPEGLAPTFYKPYVGASMEGDVVVYIDSDIVVTDSLDDVLSLAASGRICAAPDGQPQRFFADWAKMLSVAGPLRRQTYVNAGFLALAPARWPTFYPRWQELCEEMIEHSPPMHTMSFEEALVTPGGWHDQDVLNAMLMSEVSADALALIDGDRASASADMRDVVCVDPARLECRLGETQTLILHYLNGPKPWQRSGWMTTSNNAYVRLLSRLLGADDVPVRIDDAELPIWLRGGDGLRRTALFAGIRGVRTLSHVVPSSPRRRVRAFIARR